VRTTRRPSARPDPKGRSPSSGKSGAERPCLTANLTVPCVPPFLLTRLRVRQLSGPDHSSHLGQDRLPSTRVRTAVGSNCISS
jgi:hypothetical protein